VYVSLKLLQQRIGDMSTATAALKTAVESLARDMHAMQLRIAGVDNDRTRCELRSARTYVSRDELAQLVSDSTSQGERLEEKLESVHSRITEVAKSVSHLQGRVDAEGKGN